MIWSEALGKWMAASRAFGETVKSLQSVMMRGGEVSDELLAEYERTAAELDRAKRVMDSFVAEVNRHS